MRNTVLLLAFCLAAYTAAGQQTPDAPKPEAPKPEAPKPEAPKTEAAKPGTGRGGPGGAATARPEPAIKPYDQVVTKEAKSKAGVFAVHQVKEKYYYEIPKAELGKEFLWVQTIARTTLGVGYGGQALGNRVVRWTRRGDKILLEDVNYDIVADSSQPIAKAVAAANNATILQAFNVEAEGKEGTAVIEVTRMFASEVTELSARTRLRARGFDASRSFVDRISPYPANIEVDATHTYIAPPEAGPTGAGGPPAPTPGRSFTGSGMRPGSATVVVHYSMVKLPENPMMPRLEDKRVGWFSEDITDFGRDEHQSAKRSYIARWRLEKKDPAAAVSEPVKPIVYYIDPATPAKLVPYVKKGVEDWQVAFEAAGFKNAILAKEAPKDAEWSAEDARYASVRWLPSDVENAMGPHVHDPRSGEILDSDIQMYHNVMNLARSWYFVQASAVDKRAQKLPLPDDLMGELIRFVVAHEVGHTLGLPHNFKASSMYQAEKVRDKEWVAKMGHVASIMDYSRFNYVAQPEDGIPVEHLVPRIGPYDIFAIKWGYTPIPGAKTADDEKPTLDAWAREQERSPWFRFNTANARGADFGEQAEAVGDADAVYATSWGLKNIERIAKTLVSATEQKGEDYSELELMYGRLLGQWAREMNHVAALVGGVESQQKAGGQAGVIYKAVAKERQQKALEFLLANAFAKPVYFMNPDVLRRIEPEGVMTRIRSSQGLILENVLSSTRIARMVEHETVDGGWKPTEMLGALRKGVWAELGAAQVNFDPVRRNLQQSWLDAMNARLNQGAAPANLRWMFRGELKALDGEAQRALARTTVRDSRMYLEDVRDQIARILDPKFAAPASSNASTTLRRALEAMNAESLACWHDLQITADGISVNGEAIE